MKRNLLLTALCLFVYSAFAARSISTLYVNANKIYFDSKRNHVYATVDGTDPRYGNSLISINPYNATVIDSLFVGSEPSEFEFTTDSDFIYICFKEAPMIKRVNLNTFTIDSTIYLPYTTYYGYLYGRDLATIPGHNELIVVSTFRKNVSPEFGGLYVYKDGVELPKHTEDHTGSDYIESSLSNVVWGYDGGSLYKNIVNPDSGIVELSEVEGVNLGYTSPDRNSFEYNSQILCGNTGKAYTVNVPIPYQVGSYPIDPYSFDFTFELDALLNKAFYAIVENNKLQFTSYNRNTFTIRDTLTVSVSLNNFSIPEAREMIRYGNNGLATLIGESYYLTERPE